MLYFAYGSNMCSGRLRARVGEIRFVAVGRLAEHRLEFHKRGIDESAKCNAAFTGDRDHEVIGVIWEIEPATKPALDRAEGAPHHYQEKQVCVRIETGEIEVLTYLACEHTIEAGLRPYGWYHALVLAGAREHGLPDSYVEAIESVAVREDTEAERDALERSRLPGGNRR